MSQDSGTQWFSGGLARGRLLSVGGLRFAAAFCVASSVCVACSRRGSSKDLFT